MGCAMSALTAAPTWREVVPQSPTAYGSEDPPSPTIRYSHTSVMYKDSMITTHGYFYDRGNMNPNWRSDTWKLDLSQNPATWTKLWPPADNPTPREGTDNPFGRYGHTAVVYADDMIIFGGTDGGARYHANGYQPG